MGRKLKLTLFVALMAGCSADDGGNTLDSGVADGAAAIDVGLPPDSAVPDRLQQLAAWMTGSFSSEQQALQNPAFYHITLAMKRIWSDTPDGYWLYVEQAVAGQLPYRQRVYRLEQAGNGVLTSKVYEFASAQLAQKAVGAWQQPAPLAAMSEQDLVEKVGCAVHMRWDDAAQRFSGATKPKQCATTYQGATYTESEVSVTSARLTSWDRGFNDSGTQVWGATQGPYAFDKVQDLDTELKD
ncbi:MAG: chromophore lyase CpcT/CpeT [Deltaproteobacteria bacterium]|jgi:hypothetical protein|nr:chromophore lyase CpcT/CpeT [Deltaproteobacteria bacterium]